MAYGERAYLLAQMKIADITTDLNRVNTEVTALYQDFEALKKTHSELVRELERLATSLDRGVFDHVATAKIIREMIAA